MNITPVPPAPPVPPFPNTSFITKASIIGAPYVGAVTRAPGPVFMYSGALNSDHNSIYFPLMRSTRVGDTLNLYLTEATTLISVDINACRVTPASPASMITLGAPLLESYIDSRYGQYMCEIWLDKIQDELSKAGVATTGLFRLSYDQRNSSGNVVAVGDRDYNIT